MAPTVLLGLWMGSALPALAAEELSCPEGTVDSEVTFVDSTERWCAHPDGTRHGPFQRLDLSGRVLERGYYEDGERSGHWRYYDHSGTLIRTGQMQSDRPDGAWTHFDETGTASATITHGSFPAAERAPPQPADPRHRWTLPLDGTPTAWWAASPSRLVVAVGTRRLLLVSVHTGAMEADIPLPAPLRPGLKVESNRVLGVTGPGELFVVDLEPEGGGSWHRIRTPVGVTDAIASGSPDEVWVRDGTGRLAGIDLQTGNTRWTGKLYMDTLAPIHVGDRVIGSRSKRDVRALHTGDGSLAWQARMPGRILALASAAGRVLAVLSTGEVQALSAQDGAPLWSQTVPLVAGVEPRVQVLDGHTWLTTPHEAWRFDPVRGTILEHRTAHPPEGQAAADFSVGSHRTCTTGRDGGIRCTPGDWELETGASVLPPLVWEDTIVIAERSGPIRALEPTIARAIEQMGLTDTGLLVDDTLPAEVEWDGERVAIDLPWIVVERPRPSESCSVTTAAVQLPPVRSIWPSDPDVTSPPAWLWIEELTLPDDLGEGTFQVHDDWEVTPLGTTWRMSWWHRHRGNLAELHATLDEGTDPAEVDALVRCEAPPARFLGTAQVEDGVRAFRLTGQLEIHPHAHTLDGVPGCLLDVSMAGTDYGSWSSPLVPAWSEVVLEVFGDQLPEDLPLEVDVPPQLSGTVHIDAYEPWATERTDRTLRGVVELQLDPGDHRGPILRAFSGSELVLELAVPELVYGAVEEDEAGHFQPAPTIEEHLELHLPIERTTPDETWRVLWTRSSCTDDLPAREAAQPSDAESIPPAPASEAPRVRPQPLPPARSRWRRGRRSGDTTP